MQHPLMLSVQGEDNPPGSPDTDVGPWPAYHLFTEDTVNFMEECHKPQAGSAGSRERLLSSVKKKKEISSD